MVQHPALTEGRVAVVTGAASGIGLAAAKRFTSMGLRTCLADLDGSALERAAAVVASVAKHGHGSSDVLSVPTDVSKLEEVQRLKDQVYDRFGEVGVLMNNAGTSPGGGPWDHYGRWQRVLNVNLWGVINGVQSFTQVMMDQGTPCAIINTGSDAPKSRGVNADVP
jgi:NAD(P)-dependent dehydrogenase (short-subunit alcohol dehydrogenase family)